MRIFIGTLLMATAFTVQAANAAATIPDYQQPRLGTISSGRAADPRDSNATMPSSNTNSVPTRFYETPSRR